MEALTIEIPLDLAGKRLDQALSLLFPQHSRERLKGWLLSGECQVDGQIKRPRDIARGGEKINITATVEEKGDWEAEELPNAFSVVFEDEHVLVINKPAGVVVHPGAGNYQGTLVNALLHYAPKLSQLPRAGLIHRIDKDTSGLLVIAKTLEAHTNLVTQLQSRKFDRIYEAVVHKDIISGGTIDAPIGRHRTSRTKMMVRPDGRSAVTHYRVIKRFGKFTHVALKLETGRTHQIRVHLEHINHPIVGDFTYASRYKHNFHRQALHARTLGFVHPKTLEEVRFTAQTPDDILELLNNLS